MKSKKEVLLFVIELGISLAILAMIIWADESWGSTLMWCTGFLVGSTARESLS